MAREDIEAKLMKQFGDDIIVSGDSIMSNKSKIISVSPKLDMILGGGIPEGSFVVSTGPPKVGKMQDVDSIVYTPKGPKRMGDIQVGDIVCSPDGSTTKVTHIVEHGLKDVYEITFDDGSMCRCGLEHLWKVRTRYSTWKVLSLEDILSYGLSEGDGRPKWQIPLTKPVLFEEKGDILIHPYILGVLLGDGTITENISLTSVDSEIVSRCNSLLEEGFYFKKLENSDAEYFLCTSKQKNKYKKYLKYYGLLGKTSSNKFIPKEYLNSSVETRLELLKGLLDTDGEVTCRGNASFSTKSRELAEQVRYLVLSLGGLCKLSERFTRCSNCKDKKKKRKSFRLNIRFDDNSNKFHLTRKNNLSKNRTKKPLNRKIKNVRKLGKMECRCIKVASKDELYITDNFIVTHNTSMCFHFAANAQRIPSDWNKTRKVYFFNIEGRLKERDLRGINGLLTDKDHLHVIKSKPGKILTAEDFMDMGEQLINNCPGDIFIFDSFSALCTAERFNAGIGDRFRDNTPALLSMFCKRISNVIPVNKSIVMGITHMIANQGHGMSPWVEASGRKIQYQLDIKLKATHCTPWLAGDVQVGQEVHWECSSTATNQPPGGKCSSRLRYGYGIDKETEIIEICSDLGIIKKGGSWYTFPNGDKAQGLEKARQHVIDNPAIFVELENQFKEMMGINDGSI